MHKSHRQSGSKEQNQTSNRTLRRTFYYSERRKSRWYEHVSRSSGLIKIVLQGTVPGGRKMGGQRKGWEDNTQEWTGLRLIDTARESEERER